jgi:hypothetical protein
VGKAAQNGGSHLYRSYPKLGVASRHQLRDVIAAPAHESAGRHPVQATAQRQRTKRLSLPQ